MMFAPAREVGIIITVDIVQALEEQSIGKSKPFFNPNPPKFPLQVQMQMHPFPEKSH